MESLQKSLWELISQSSTLTRILERSPSLQIPNWYFGAGCLAQTIWNLKTGNPPNQHINDVDWVYFDESDLSEATEKEIEARVRAHFSDIPLKFDVKNQARVHTWYAKKFGYEIAPYQSVEAAIRTWPTTATAVAITRDKGAATIFSPYGLTDLLSLTVRANKAQITEEIYLAKVTRWRKCWPSLSVVPWSESE
jgi:hypothetical protein